MGRLTFAAAIPEQGRGAPAGRLHGYPFQFPPVAGKNEWREGSIVVPLADLKMWVEANRLFDINQWLHRAIRKLLVR